MLTSIHHIPSTPASATIVMLHGRGADEHDLFGLKGYLDPSLEIHSLRAPYEFEWGGYAWFDLFPDGSVDLESVTHSKQEITTFLDTLNSERIFILGFSMGAIMAYAIALTEPKRCSGIIALSGFAPVQLEQEYRLNDLNGLPIFISHGINDPIIPVTEARRTRALLEGSTASVTYREYPMAHQIDDACLSDINTWLKER